MNLTKLAVVGCGCSTVTEVAAKNQVIPIVWIYELQISHDHYNISHSVLILMQISYASSSSVLNDRSVYPTLFRTVPSDEVLAPALATLMNYYGWRKVAILTEKKPQFEKVITFAIYFHTFFTYYWNKMYSMPYSVAYSFYSYSTVL